MPHQDRRQTCSQPRVPACCCQRCRISRSRPPCSEAKVLKQACVISFYGSPNSSARLYLATVTSTYRCNRWCGIRGHGLWWANGRRGSRATFTCCTIRFVWGSDGGFGFGIFFMGSASLVGNSFASLAASGSGRTGVSVGAAGNESATDAATGATTSCPSTREESSGLLPLGHSSSPSPPRLHSSPLPGELAYGHCNDTIQGENR